VVALAFSPDAQWLAAGSQEPVGVPGARLKGEATVWDLNIGKQVATLPQSQWVQDVAFAPNGKLLAVALGQVKSSEEITRLGDGAFPGEVVFYQTGTFKQQGLVRFDAPVHRLAFSPDSQSLVVACIGRNDGGEPVRLLDVARQAERSRLIGIQSAFPAIALPPDGKSVAVSDLIRGAGRPTGQIRFLDLGTGKEQSSLHLQGALLPSGMTYFPDGKTMLLVGNSSVGQLDLDNGNVRNFPGLPQHGVQGGCSVSSDGKLLALCENIKGSTQEARFLLWDLAAGKDRARWTMPNQSFRALQFSPDGKLLAGGGLGPPPGGLVKVWKTP